MEKRVLQIAIDGPVGAGKGTLGVALAKRLNTFYVYTGGMYRALTLACIRENVDIYNEIEVLDVLKRSSIELKSSEYGSRVFLNGKEIFDEMYLSDVTSATPIVAAFTNVRREMVARQKSIIEGKSVVVEGRDIATDVAPCADLKVYLTADVQTRAKRRLAQLQKRGVEQTLDETIEEIKKRDRQDIERGASPLTITPDAYVLNTTNLTIEETVDKVMDELKRRGIFEWSI